MSDFPVSSAGFNAVNLLQHTGSAKGTGPGQLAHAAKEFESILLSQWLQGAECSFGSVPGADDDADPGDEQMKSFAVQSLAKAFTDSGGIGLAKLVSKALDGQAAAPATSLPAAPKVR